MNLSEIMKEFKITSAALAEKTDIPKRTIDEYRSGRKSPSFVNGMKIADALQVDPHRLL